MFSFDVLTGALAASGTTLYGFAKTDDSSLADYVSTVTITNSYVGSSSAGPTVEVGDGDVDDKNKWLGMRPEGKTASWTNQSGHSAPEIAINNETLKVTVDARPANTHCGFRTMWCSRTKAVMWPSS